jgi:hypothetical protein
VFVFADNIRLYLDACAFRSTVYGIDHFSKAKGRDKETVPHLHRVKWEYPLWLR